jgi:glycoprotein 2-beta-D-xylosyltransferase
MALAKLVALLAWLAFVEPHKKLQEAQGVLEGIEAARAFGRKQGLASALEDEADPEPNCEDHYGPRSFAINPTVIYEDPSSSTPDTPLPSSLVCYGGQKRTICHARGLAIVPALLRMPAGANEMAYRMAGAKEEDEFPQPARGALQLRGGDRQGESRGRAAAESPILRRRPHNPRDVLQQLLNAVEFVEALPTSAATHLDPTILVVRIEYVNLWHTMSDWFNAYTACALLGWSPAAVDVVWLDAHPRGALDGPWRSLFRSGRHLSDRLAPQQPLAFAEAVLLPTNHDSALTEALLRHDGHGGAALRCKRPYTHIEAFSALLAGSYGLLPKPCQPYWDEFGALVQCASSTPNWSGAAGAAEAAGGVEVVVALRGAVTELTHARAVRGGEVRGATTLRHVSELEAAFEAAVPSTATATAAVVTTVTFTPGDFAGMRVVDQLRAVRRADVLAGAHGAGLSWVLAMRADALGVLEWGPTQGPHFEVLAALRQLRYKFEHEFDAAKLAVKLVDLVMVGSGSGGLRKRPE